MRIYLIGFMGAGKTSVGKCLARTLGYRFVDLDDRIENEAGMGIPAMFDSRGEAYFRALEHVCLRRTWQLDDVVVATGGGTPTFAGNRALLARLGTAIWLHPEFDTIVARLKAGDEAGRPLFRSHEQALSLYRRRTSTYRAADLQVDVAPHEAPQQVASRIVSLLREPRCAT